MTVRRGYAMAALGMLLALAGAPMAFAQTVELPHDWQFGMQPAASPVREHIDTLHNELLVIITLISLFVMGLLLYAMVRFSAKNHPVPTKTTHNTLLEISWTGIPVVVLVLIAVGTPFLPGRLKLPGSFALMYYTDRAQHADMTLKVTGHQWYWTYEYPDNGDFSFDSNMMAQEDAIKAGKPRLLEVDNPVVLPVGTVVRVLVAGSDVMHSWFVPSMGVQEYAVVGRVNESWLSIDHEGTYYGQCNQICGINHPFMPIEIKGVSKPEFDQWVTDAKKKFARDVDGAARVASSPLPAPGAGQGGVHAAGVGG